MCLFIISMASVLYGLDVRARCAECLFLADEDDKEVFGIIAMSRLYSRRTVMFLIEK